MSERYGIWYTSLTKAGWCHNERGHIIFDTKAGADADLPGWLACRHDGESYEARPYKSCAPTGAALGQAAAKGIREQGNAAAAKVLDEMTVTAVLRLRADNAEQRANQLADECGRLRDENRDLLAENARLRRQVERAGRK